MLAASHNHTNCIQTLQSEIKLQTGTGLTALMTSVKAGAFEACKLLLDEAGLQTKTKIGNFASGTTALMIAQYYKREEFIKILKPLEENI